MEKAAGSGAGVLGFEAMTEAKDTPEKPAEAKALLAVARKPGALTAAVSEVAAAASGVATLAETVTEMVPCRRRYAELNSVAPVAVLMTELILTEQVEHASVKDTVRNVCIWIIAAAVSSPLEVRAEEDSPFTAIDTTTVPPVAGGGLGPE